MLGVGIIRSRSITFLVRQRGFGSSSLRLLKVALSYLGITFTFETTLSANVTDRLDSESEDDTDDDEREISE